jgi:hypothetical protein
MRNYLAIITALTFFVTASTLEAQESEGKQRRYSIVVSSEYINSAEIANSSTNYNYFVGTVAFQTMVDKRWGFRLGVQPLLWAKSNIEGLESTNGLGANISWIGYFSSKSTPAFYVDFSVSGVVFNDVVPVANAKKFNWTIGAGGGVEIPVSSSNAVLFGCRYSHISNSNTGNRNPGVNGHTLVFGIRYKL